MHTSSTDDDPFAGLDRDEVNHAFAHARRTFRAPPPAVYAALAELIDAGFLLEVQPRIAEGRGAEAGRTGTYRGTGVASGSAAARLTGRLPSGHLPASSAGRASAATAGRGPPPASLLLALEACEHALRVPELRAVCKRLGWRGSRREQAVHGLLRGSRDKDKDKDKDNGKGNGRNQEQGGKHLNRSGSSVGSSGVDRLHSAAACAVLSTLGALSGALSRRGLEEETVRRRAVLRAGAELSAKGALSPASERRRVMRQCNAVSGLCVDAGADALLSPPSLQLHQHLLMPILPSKSSDAPLS